MTCSSQSCNSETYNLSPCILSHRYVLPISLYPASSMRVTSIPLSCLIHACHLYPSILPHPCMSPLPLSCLIHACHLYPSIRPHPCMLPLYLYHAPSLHVNSIPISCLIDACQLYLYPASSLHVTPISLSRIIHACYINTPPPDRRVINTMTT